MNVTWNVFDPDVEVTLSVRNLPHWDQIGALTFVTLRLADSMPQQVVKQWHEEIEKWLDQHGLTGRNVEQVLEDPLVPEKTKQSLKKFKHRHWHGHLDNCHGQCPLRSPQLARIVADSFLHFNNQKYDLERFVVMPNHAHLLIQMRPGFELRKQLSETMRYSARLINKKLNRKGAFWQSEPFDHIVRSDEQFTYLQNYILENPVKANLKAGEYIFWKHEPNEPDYESESRAT